MRLNEKEAKEMKFDFIGLEEVDTEILKCGDCGTKLIEIVLTETNENRQSRGLKPQKTQYKVTRCYKCGGKSFNSKVFEGSSIIGPYKLDLDFDTGDTEITDEGVVLVEVLVRKK